jgi:hypothetical protein
MGWSAVSSESMECLSAAGSAATCIFSNHHITAIFKTPTRQGKWIDVFRLIGYKFPIFIFGFTGRGDVGFELAFVPP